MPAQHEEAAVFLDFSTAAERLREKRFIAREFKGQNGAWYLVTLIAKNRDKNGNVTHLLVSARNIDEQKTKELEYQKISRRPRRKRTAPTRLRQTSCAA